MEKSCWHLDGGRCPCGGDLATNGERVWCTAPGCDYERECGDWTCAPVAAERKQEDRA